MKSMGKIPSAHYRAHGSGRKPLRTITELAQEFGVTVNQLAGCIGKDRNAPAYVFKNGQTVNGNKSTWYNPDELRAWWKGRNEKATA